MTNAITSSGMDTKIHLLGDCKRHNSLTTARYYSGHAQKEFWILRDSYTTDDQAKMKASFIFCNEWSTKIDLIMLLDFCRVACILNPSSTHQDLAAVYEGISDLPEKDILGHYLTVSLPRGPGITVSPLWFDIINRVSEDNRDFIFKALEIIQPPDPENVIFT